MFAINHAAAALIVKKRYPEAPLPLLLISVQGVELLWVLLNWLGWENTSTEAAVASVKDIHLELLPFSHSLFTTAIIALMAWWVLDRIVNKPVVAAAVAWAVSSHIILDLLTHSPDIALVPFLDGPMLGLGLYDVPVLAFGVEMLFGIFCWRYYRGGKALLTTIVVFNLMNASLFIDAVHGPEAWFAHKPLLLTSVIFGQIIITLVLVGLFARRRRKHALVEQTADLH